MLKKSLCLFLALLMLSLSLAACAKEKTPDETTDTAESTGETTPDENDPFAGVDFKGESFDIYTSVNQATVSMVSSNVFIEGSEELTGDAALDTVLKRNDYVSELLDVNFTYAPADYNCEEVAAAVRQLVLSGDDTFELIINDMYGLVPISPEGLFRNTLDEENFDFTAPWWYDDFMSDISLNANMRFALAGDYFIDQLRTTHCLVMNKDIYRDICGDPDEMYQDVIDRKWTLDRYIELNELAHIDKNGNGERDSEDQYGSIGWEVWGCLIPWVISGDPGFIERDAEGYPTITIDNDKSYTLIEKLNTIFNNDASWVEMGNTEQDYNTMFTSGYGLFLWYQRLASLESATLRQADVDLAVLPYPLRDSTQPDYVTSAHDTTEIGYIPVSVPGSSMPFVTTVIEVLCRETNRQVLPVYYESSLKIKYTRDKLSGQMIDIIHDHYGNGFALMWSLPLNGVFLHGTFLGCVRENSNAFASKCKKVLKTASRQLTNYINKSEDVIYEQKIQDEAGK